jgi:hypothetical protein
MARAATGMPYWVRRRVFQREVGLADFSGGLNLRDAPSELANNETPDCMNVTLTEIGGVQKRLGYAKKNGTAFTTVSAPQNLFRWQSAGVEITQCGASLFKDNGTSAVQTFSTAARVGFAEFGTAVYAIHPVDGIYSSTDGSSWSAVSGSPKGTCLEPWQNRLLAGGDPSNPPRLYASTIGDATNWTVDADHGWTNDIREHDSQPIVAIKAASGVDIAGKPGCLVFKNGSSYRVNDSDTGAYQTIDTSVGAASAISVVNLFELTFVLHQTGIYVTNGVSALTLLSARLQPLFTPAGVAFDQTALFAAGASYTDNRVHFSLPRAGSAANDLHLELHANLKLPWIVPHTDAMSCYCSDGEALHGGSPTVAGQVYELGVGGSDDGSDIACYFQTKWLAPTGGIECRFRRLRVFGRGRFDLYVKRDFDIGTGDLSQTVLTGSGMVWGSGSWGVDQWGPTVYETYQDFWSLGKGVYIALRLEETSSLVAYEPPLLGSGMSPQIGSFALFSFVLQYIPISL